MTSPGPLDAPAARLAVLLRWPRPRLLPLVVVCAVALGGLKAASLWAGDNQGAPAEGAAGVVPARGIVPARPTASRTGLIASAAAAGTETEASPAAATPRGAAAPAADPDPVAAAERAVLETLRNRRAALEAREAGLSAREAVLAAAERRLTARLDEMAALQARLEALERARGEREEAGWRGLVRTYEAMRPRDAAAVFDDLEPSVLLGIADRMSERKAAAVIAAMRPDRARTLTAELARARAARAAVPPPAGAPPAAPTPVTPG